MCDSCVEWGGRRWHSYGGGYYERTDKSVKPKRTIRLHRAVWEHHNGPIPAGHHVHHADHNILNNDPANLQLMAGGDHSRHHLDGREITERQRQASGGTMRRLWAEAVETTTACAACGTQFQSRARTGTPRRFCSSKCLERWRMAAPGPIERGCDLCGARYTAKRRNSRFCSRGCSARHSQQHPISKDPRPCEHCGEIFQGRRGMRFCRKACADDARSQGRRKVTDAPTSVLPEGRRRA
jgi:hypothetical protein